MISVITAVHNQLAVNRIFWENLKRNTRSPFELIIVDNASTDDSAAFFESVGATVIRNRENWSYPVSQNQGIAIARHDWLGFLNNDIIVSPGWDERLMASMQANELEAATVCGIEQIETAAATRRLKKRWNAIKNTLSLFSKSEDNLRRMHRWMYPDWAGFCADRAERFKGQVKEGFVGNTVMLRRSSFDKIGLWDERVQAADFDLYLRSKARSLSHRDIRPVHIALDSFVHHYIRLTLNAGYPPFADLDQLISLEEKWPAEQRAWLNALNK
ncbi:MAG: glycosyltransferase [Moraxellaceae bacterium]|nr:glycosyltransferase [Moraxellaceae bacterium]